MSITAGLVAAIETTWAAIQKQHEDVPEVVVTMGAGSIHKSGLVLGHFAPNRWVAGEDARTIHELFIGGEGLQLGARSVLATLLHEAAHSAAATRGIKDTSRQGRYHNDRFRQIGEEFGLTLTHTRGLGWSDSQLSDTTASRYTDQVAQLEGAIIAYRRGEGGAQIITGGDEDGAQGEGDGAEEGESTTKPKNGYAPVCGCGRKIRVAATTYDAGPILCGLCGTAFAIPES
jgi:hypothetical protein